jgi:hypothetical protein
MTACVLCLSSLAVADLLCVPCGAKLWAARYMLMMAEVAEMPAEWQLARAKALRELADPAGARLFMVFYNAALAAHEARNKELDRKDER